MNYCTHYECRLDTAQHLLWMAERLKRDDLAQEAIGSMNRLVRCRHQQVELQPQEPQ